MDEQREQTRAAYTDPEGVDLTFDEASGLQEDVPPDLRAMILDRQVYGPEVRRHARLQAGRAPTGRGAAQRPPSRRPWTDSGSLPRAR